MTQAELVNRRQSIRRAVLLAIGMALGKLDALNGQNGMLTVPLDQWRVIVFEYQGKRIEVLVSEVFEALSEVK